MLHGCLKRKAQGNLWLDTDGVQGAPARDASSRFGMVRRDGSARSAGILGLGFGRRETDHKVSRIKVIKKGLG